MKISSVATSVFREMEDQIASLLRDCRDMSRLKKIHAIIITSSLCQSSFLATKMVDFCCLKRDLFYARAVFDQANQPNVFLYNAMIKAYANNFHYEEAVRVYSMMMSSPSGVSGNRFTYPFVIKACSGLQHVNLGRTVHGHVFKCGPASNSIIEISLLEMYAKCDEMECAQAMFDEMPERDAVSWNVLIFAYARSGKIKKAKIMFDSMPTKTLVSWTQMISVYFRCGRHSEAMRVFHDMQVAGMKPDAVSIVAILPVCAQLGALEMGKWIHTYSDKNELLKMVHVCNALTEIYSKCGSIDETFRLFDGMTNKDVISWSTMINGFANHSRAHEAISLFKAMQMVGVRPNEITFIGVLSACVHEGLLIEGMRYFDAMTVDYCLKPDIGHYGCIVDLLACLGHFSKAIDFIGTMPLAPDAAIWGSVLAASRTYRNVETAILAMENLIELEPGDSGNYILLANTYAASGKWDDMSRIRKVMRSRGMKKIPGCSLIEINNVVHEFVVGASTLLSAELYAMLKLLASECSGESMSSTSSLSLSLSSWYI